MSAGSSVRQFTRAAPGPVSHWDLGNFADPSTLLPKSARRNANAIMPSKRRATSLLTCYKLARERGAYGAGVGIAAGHGHSDRVAGLPCAQERVEDLELQRRRMAFLYSDGTSCVFQRLDTFDQVEIPVVALGTAEKFLQPGIEIPVEFFQEEPIHVVLPDVVECRVATTTPPMRSQPDSGRKEATLENGLSLQVPLFVAPGETVRVDVKPGRYVERVRMEHKKGA